jgi:Ubiquitin-2 like Rad60 SUMO-like
MSDHDQSPSGPPAGAPQPPSEHLNIKVTDGNNEVFFKIKRSTKLEKLMNAFCERQGKQMSTVRFLFDGQRVQPTDSPDTVSPRSLALFFQQHEYFACTQCLSFSARFDCSA